MLHPCVQVDNRMRAWYQKNMAVGLLYTCSLGEVRVVNAGPGVLPHTPPLHRHLTEQHRQAECTFRLLTFRRSISAKGYFALGCTGVTIQDNETKGSTVGMLL